MEKKLRSSTLINLKSRSPETIEKFSDWLDAQKNAQNSILALIEHSIDRFGYVDVTDHEISKKMHTEFLFYDNKSVVNTFPIIQENQEERINDIYQEIPVVQQSEIKVTRSPQNDVVASNNELGTVDRIESENDLKVDPNSF